MASRYYGTNVGANKPSDVTEGASTGSKAVELVVDKSKCTNKLQLLMQLEVIWNYIVSTETDPIA